MGATDRVITHGQSLVPFSGSTWRERDSRWSSWASALSQGLPPAKVAQRFPLPPQVRPSVGAPLELQTCQCPGIESGPSCSDGSPSPYSTQACVSENKVKVTKWVNSLNYLLSHFTNNIALWIVKTFWQKDLWFKWGNAFSSKEYFIVSMYDLWYSELHF